LPIPILAVLVLVLEQCLPDGAALRAKPAISAQWLRERLLAILSTSPETRKFLAVAQELEDAVGEVALEATLQRILRMPGAAERSSAPWWPAMKRRIALIRAIPFRAVLTTNFTEVFEGGRELTDPDLSLVDALRGRAHGEATEGLAEADADMGGQANSREIALLQVRRRRHATPARGRTMSCLLSRRPPLPARDVHCSASSRPSPRPLSCRR